MGCASDYCPLVLLCYNPSQFCSSLWLLRLARWYVSVVSIIFDCSMPILYNFHILLATFHTIFGTNILIQCPVLVPVCCMFYVSQKPYIKRRPNGIKMDRELFWNIWKIWEKDQRETVSEVGTRQGRAPDPRGHLGHLLDVRPTPKIPINTETSEN